jgi:hypothetical protein
MDRRNERAHWWPETGVHEARLWYDPLTRAAGIVARDDLESFPLSAVTMVADYVHGIEGGVAWVDDLKTGAFPPDPVCPQLLMGALCLHRMTGAGNDGIVLSISHLPRYPLASPLVRTAEKVFTDQLEGFERRIWELYGSYMLERERLDRDLPMDVRVGDYCKWCKCRRACPAWYEMYRKLEAEDLEKKKKGKSKS